jgi:hypothetical protein
MLSTNALLKWQDVFATALSDIPSTRAIVDIPEIREIPQRR